MLSEHLRFNLYLYIVAGLCLPKGIVKLKWPMLYYVYMAFTDILSLLSLITIGANLVAPNVDLTKRCYSGFTAIATALSMTKLIACYIHKNSYSEYFNLWDELIESDADEELKEKFAKNKRATRRLSLCLFVFMVSPMIPWGSLPLFIKMLSYFVPGLEDSYGFIAVPAQFPFDPIVTPAFEFTTMFQGLAALIINAKLMAYDCMIYGLISCQIVQYKNLKKCFKGTIKKIIKDETQGIGAHDVITFNETKLHNWVEKHCKLTEFCYSLNKLYSPVLLIQFIFNILILCSNVFVVAAATVTKLEVLFSFGYVIGTVIQLYTICWIGEEITNRSLTVTDEGFWGQFYVRAPKVHSSLSIIFERTKRPVKISALGTFHLSIETFKSIVGTAFSYFMVLNQIKKNI